MSKSKVRLSEVDELSDAGALEHSRGKYARLRQAGGGDSKEGEGSSRDEVPKEYESKHTLDSDEEEDMKYTKLDVEEKEDEIKDAWLDNIDWTKFFYQYTFFQEEDSSTAINFGDSELKSVYERIAAMLKPNETIEHALSRLGKEKGLSAAEERKRRWAAKKAGREYVDEGAAAMKELTGLADSLVSNGELEAYQYTLEKLLFLIKELQTENTGQVEEEKAAGKSSSDVVFWEYKLSNEDGAEIFGPFTSEQMLEMQQEGKFENGGWARKQGAQSFYTEEEQKGAAAEKSSSDVVFWEYKLSNEDGAEIFGPFTSEQMLEMQQEGKFENGGWARKQGAQSFYTVARIDFEIYT
ncbi:unnamed protein product [Gongylonema pulchrum]|uniref:GYF domain-containing protein n=1 Tax=Gongylonema pulchrum TaxID=637853 RepID=A0A183E2G2_9BILA|nr:unnamed protein product [Gongylonema pulchrum]